MEYALGQTQLDRIEDVLQSDVMNLGVTCVALIDLSGNIIAHLDTGVIQNDIYCLAALSAGNFAAVNAMAKSIGEGEFHILKGTKESIHFSKVMEDFLLVTVFGEGVTLGFLRVKTTGAIDKIEGIMTRAQLYRPNSTAHETPVNLGGFQAEPGPYKAKACC